MADLSAEMAVLREEGARLAAEHPPRADLPPAVEARLAEIFRRQGTVLRRIGSAPIRNPADAGHAARAVALAWPDGDPMPDEAAPVCSALVRFLAWA